MPPATRAFDVAPDTKSITLDGSGKGELTFTVKNLLDQDVRAQAKPVPEGKTQERWLTLDAPATKEVKADRDVKFTARIAVPTGDRPPKGAAPVDYGFHLLVSAVDNPDERYAEGPPISFKVPPVTNGGPPRWIIVAVAVAVLAMAGGVVWYLLSRNSKVGGACPEGKCPAHLACVTREGAQRCLYVPGEACKSDGECASDVCTDGKCLAFVKAGDPCPTGRCTFGLTCVVRGGAKTCLVAVGAACAAPTDCVSGRCDGGKCSEVPVQTRCQTAADCDAREVCVSLVEGQFCLLKGEQTCRTPLDCASRFCREDGLCSDEQGRCRDNRDCRPQGFFCKTGVCRKTDGQPCTASAECASGFCTAAAGPTCAQPPPDRQCFPACTPPRFCLDGRCTMIHFPPGKILRQEIGRTPVVRDLQ